MSRLAWDIDGAWASHFSGKLTRPCPIDFGLECVANQYHKEFRLDLCCVFLISITLKHCLPARFVQEATIPIRVIFSILPCMTNCRHPSPALNAKASLLDKLSGCCYYLRIASEAFQSAARLAGVRTIRPCVFCYAVCHGNAAHALIATAITITIFEIIAAMEFSVPHGQPPKV